MIFCVVGLVGIVILLATFLNLCCVLLLLNWNTIYLAPGHFQFSGRDGTGYQDFVRTWIWCWRWRWCCSWCWRCARTRAALGRSEAACRKVGQGRRKSSSLLPRHSSTLPLKLDTKSTRTPCFDKQCARKHWRSVQPSAEYISYLIYFTILMHCLHCSALAATPSREKPLLFLEVGADTRSHFAFNQLTEKGIR